MTERARNSGFREQRAAGELDLIPGLLQIEAYMRAVLSKGNRSGHSKEWIDNQVIVRLRRAKRLTAEIPLALHAVLDERCPRRNFSRKIMREQVELVLERANLPNVTVQVVPDCGHYLGMRGAFAGLDYPYPAESGVAFIPHAAGSVHLDDPGELQDCRLDFEYIVKMALSPEDSRAFIQEVVASL